MINIEVLAHDLAVAMLNQRLRVEYKDKVLNQGEIYGLYQDCFQRILDQINNGGLET